jgi:thymidylate synthase ThyX
MTIEAEVICDSACETTPHRLTTFRVKCPAMIHQEQLRHRAHSFSVSSMRAIPLAKQTQAVLDNPAMPVEWGSAKKGMQAGEELSSFDQQCCREQWVLASRHAAEHAQHLGSMGLHKQVAARVLAPFSHYEMVITSCAPGLMNFFALRCSRQTDPTMRRLAVRMADAYRKSVPQVLQPGWWHLPYVTQEEKYEVCRDMASAKYTIEDITSLLLKFSVARCARVSYLRHGLDHSEPQKDIESHDRFIKSGHWSVLEHQARMPLPGEDIRGLEGNLPGVIQYRQILKPNVYTDFDFSILDTEFAGDLQ